MMNGSAPNSDASARPWTKGGQQRIRFAEILYEHEGFCDVSNGFHMPDRHVPVWIERSLTEDHCGDCTRIPAACMRCHAETALVQWDELAAALAQVPAREDEG